MPIEHFPILLAALTLLLEIVVVIVGAVWVVAQIRLTTGKLAVNIEHLSKAVDALAAKSGTIETKLNDHDGRIRVLESAR